MQSQVLNELCVYVYNNHEMKEASDNPKIRRKVLSFQENDKIMVTRNAQVLELVPNDIRTDENDSGDEATRTTCTSRTHLWRIRKERLTNGTVFKIIQACDTDALTY